VGDNTWIANVDREQVTKIAEYLGANPPETTALNFYSFPGRDGKPDIRADWMYPEVDHPQVLDFFFFGCLHDYGFWYGGEKGYVAPLLGLLGDSGKPLKGSDLLWQLLKKELDMNPLFFSVDELADISGEVLSCCLADNVGTQWPDFEHRLRLTQAWGKWLYRNNLTPALIVEEANRNVLPLKQFLEILSTSPFGRDPMMKKAVLLAMVLYNRPERFLHVSEQDAWPAIVDYHLMRVSLRLGMVKLADVTENMNKMNAARQWVAQDIEHSIRNETRQAVEQLQAESGLTHGQIDNILWQARRFCPEMKEPDCENCLFSSVCEKRTELFQPVIRTDAY
jgi:hypothetical protein